MKHKSTNSHNFTLPLDVINNGCEALSTWQVPSSSDHIHSSPCRAQQESAHILSQVWRTKRVHRKRYLLSNILMGRCTRLLLCVTTTICLLVVQSISTVNAASVRSSSLSEKQIFGELEQDDMDEKSDGNINQISSEPEIECGYGVVHFRVHTTKSHASAIYVRGQSSTPGCAFHNTKNATIDLAKCNIRRKREVNPSGVAYQMTVIVQLHPLFVTKVDRAYNVNCFYLERQQDVNADFTVSDITTQMVMMDATLPQCVYSVRRDSPNGPLVKYTKVGEQLYHVWDCPSKTYAMLLYNCVAIDGKGEEYGIIDENGCSKDEFLMPQISYTAENTKAMVASAAFNFPDRNTMSFTCKIRLCYINDCKSITPPRCGRKDSRAVGGDEEETLLQDLIDSEQFHEVSASLTSTTAVAPLSSTDFELESSVSYVDATAPSTSSTETIDFSITESGGVEKEEIQAKVVSKIFDRKQDHHQNLTTISDAAMTTVMRHTATTPVTKTTPFTTQTAEAEEVDESPMGDRHEGGVNITSDNKPFPDDFPRPDDLIVSQADDPLQFGGSGELLAYDESIEEGVEVLTRRRKNDSMRLLEPVAENLLQRSSINALEISGNSPPLTILYKGNNSAKINRQQRDTTAVIPAPAAAAMLKEQQQKLRQEVLAKADGSSGILHVPTHVDIDIESDEITIMDDYAALSSSTKSFTEDTPSAALRNLRAVEEKDHFHINRRQDMHLSSLFDAVPESASGTIQTSMYGRAVAGTTVCFSVISLILVASLFALLFVTSAVVLLKTRKNMHRFN